MLKAKTSKKILSPKIGKILTFWGAGDQGVWNVAIVTAKVSSLRECTSFKPFLSVGGSDLQRWAAGKKLKKSRVAPIGMMCRR